jgi:hypothetical protein
MSFEDWSDEDPFDDRYYDYEEYGSAHHSNGYAKRSPEVDYIRVSTEGKKRETEKAVLFNVCLATGGIIEVWVPKFCILRSYGDCFEVREDFWERKLDELAGDRGVVRGLIGVRAKKRKKAKKPKKEKGMQSKQLVHLIQQGYTTVKVSFRMDGVANNLYTYKTNIALEPDDIVVVPARGEFKTAQVITVDKEPEIDLDSDIDYKWVVQKVDGAAWEELNRKERELAKTITGFEHKQRRKALLASLGISGENAELLALTQVGNANAISASEEKGSS